ncbi:MAG: FprA family A-type flavoprotein [Cellulosilyticaceae bacterium]
MSDVITIKPGFFWVGALDPNLRVFDIVMETEFGTTYNSYLLKGSEKTAIFETVKDKFFDEFLEKVSSVCDPMQIDYIVVNHTEPDHSGSVVKLLDYAPQAIVVGSALAIKYMTQIINKPFNSLVVKEGDTLNLGNKTVKFISVPFLHWPDSMYSYIEEDKTLVTCDSFGAHYSDGSLFRSSLADGLETDFLSAYKYYYDMIMGPFKPYVLKALDKIKDLSLDYICPGHGMVLDREYISTYMSLYKEWSLPNCRSVPSVVIPYASAYGYTGQLAEKIAAGVKAERPDLDVLVYDMVTTDFNEILSEVSMCSGLLIGSSTIVSDTVPPVWQLLTSLNATIHSGMKAGCFGSYGWSGEAITNISERFKQLKFKTPVEPLKILFKPSEKDLQVAYEFGISFAKAL